MSLRTHLLALLVCLPLFSACGGESGPATVRIFGLNPETRTYGLFDARLDVADLGEMRGEAVRFRGGATIKGDALAANSDPKSENILQARGGGPVRCAFHERDGVLHADDYDSLNMASSYWALEQSRNLFIELGVERERLNTIDAYYHPRIEMLTKVVPTYFLFVDNAAYGGTFDGFMILPHVAMDAVPFSANPGVMAHEYAHKVMNVLVERSQRVAAWLRNDWELRAANQLRGVDEGLADMYGHLLTGDPNFMQPSVEGLGIDLDRDMRTVRVDDADLVDEWLGLTDPDPLLGNPFRQHVLGAHVAGALWQFGANIGDHRRVAIALLDVQREIGDEISASGNSPYDFSVLGFFDKVAARFTDAERQRFCSVVRQRFPTLIAVDTAHAMGNCP